jgi:hypothetical protein
MFLCGLFNWWKVIVWVVVIHGLGLSGWWSWLAGEEVLGVVAFGDCGPVGRGVDVQSELGGYDGGW